MAKATNSTDPDLVLGLIEKAHRWVAIPSPEYQNLITFGALSDSSELQGWAWWENGISARIEALDALMSELADRALPSTAGGIRSDVTGLGERIQAIRQLFIAMKARTVHFAEDDDAPSFDGEAACEAISDEIEGFRRIFRRLSAGLRRVKVGLPYEEEGEQQGLRMLCKTETREWRLVFDGKDVLIPDYAGLRRYATLLARPHEAIQAAELIQPGSPPGDTSVFEMIDPEIRKALREIRAEIQHLEDEKTRLLELGQVEAAALQEEEIERQLKVVSTYGRAGRERSDSEQAQKARKTAATSMAYARKRLKEPAPEFAEYLEKAVKASGTSFMFDPAPGDRPWEVEEDLSATR